MNLRTFGRATLEKTSWGLGLLGAALLSGAVFSACGTSTPPTNTGGTSAGGSGGASGGTVGSGGDGSGGTLSGGSNSGGSAAGGSATGGADAAGGSASVDCSEPSDAGPLTTRLPCQLSLTGLYEADMATLAAGVHTYTPTFHLWTDSAAKKRWIQLPEGTQIDTTDMDFWVFPPGTKLWKEFSRDDVRVETRLIEKQASGAWRAVAYQWREDQMEADAVPNGLQNASGTPHDIPNGDDCMTCHSQQPDKALGFGAIQLSHEPADAADPLEWTLQTLIDDDLLTAPPAATFTVPGTPEEVAFFGYLHANCGHCHNPTGTANDQTNLDMWLKVADLDGPVTEFSVYQNLVDIDIVKTDGAHPAATKRVAPGAFADSAVYQRFMDKTAEWTMPPLGTEDVDPTGQSVMEAWIGSLPPP
jgi:hypothetical protein